MVTEHDRRLQSTSPVPSPTTYCINRKVTGTAPPTPLKYRNTTCTLRRSPLKISRLVPGSFSTRSGPEGTETELVEKLDVVEASKRRSFDGEVTEQEEGLTDSGSEQPSDNSEGRKKSVLSNRLAVMADTGTDVIEFAVPPETESTEKKIEGAEMDTEPPQSATHPSNEAGIEAKGILPNTDTVVQVSENDSDRETMTKDSNFFGKVPISNEPPEEQRNDRGNVKMHIDLDKVQQAQASDAIGRQQRKAAGRTRKRLPEVIDLTDESASGPSSSGRNITEMYSDADGIFVRKRVRPNGTPNDVVTIASDDEQEIPPVNLDGRGIDGPAIRSNRLHVPIGLDHTITTGAFTAPRSEDFDRVGIASNNNENMNKNDNEVEIDGVILSNEHLSNEEDRDFSGQRHVDGVHIFAETGHREDLSNDKEMPSRSSYPPIVVGDSSTGNTASISSPSIADSRTENKEIIILDDDDGIANTRPSPTPCTPLAHPRKESLTSHIEQFPQLECSVCLDIPQFLSYTDCGHVYCEECIRSAVKVHHKCPVCRKNLTLANIRILQPLLQFED